ncbi:MAG: hypothetical protein HY428_01170 [Candidatus Levybacteria bacterium]|nr:hypothetical protein [Candidatus Levybacteria bacterium]
MRRIAQVISNILNPIVLLFPAPYFLVLRTTNDGAIALRWAVFSWIFLLLISVIIIYCVRRGIFSDLDVSKREQRPLLFLFSAMLTFFYCLFVFLLGGPYILIVTALGLLFGILVFSIINSRVKASIHVATISALLFTLGIVYSGVYLLLFLLIPLVGWARVKTGRHTVSETIAGSVIGSLLTLFMYIIVKYLF